MANSLKIYLDSGLTIEASTALIASQNMDGSSPPYQKQLWLGSTISSRKFQASTDPGVDQVYLGPVNATPVWSANTVKALNDEVRTTAKNGYKYQATSIGSLPNETGAAEPTWPVVIGNTVIDGDITWTCMEKFHESTEMKLATTSGGLAGATSGAALNVGLTLTSEVANAFEFWVQVDDTTGVVATRTELSVQTNETDETDA